MFLLSVNLENEGFLILSLSLAESVSHSRRLAFAERLHPAVVAHASRMWLFCCFLAVYRLLQELVAEW